MISVAVLASGRGSNFEAIQKSILEKKLQAAVVAVVSDQKEAPVLTKAKAYGIPAFYISADGFTREQHEARILEKLADFKPQFLVMAGYMRIITDRLLQAFRTEKGYSRIVNIHPSLLPSFPGLNSYRQAFRHGVKVTGVTVHLVENSVDSGPICVQQAFSIEDCLTEAEVEEKGLRIEHQVYPEALSWILEEKFSLENRSEGRVCVHPN